MSHDKRKKIKQERRRVREAGIELPLAVRARGDAADWDFFTWCYNRTYRQHHSTPYLNRAFFRRLARVHAGQRAAGDRQPRRQADRGGPQRAQRAHAVRALLGRGSSSIPGCISRPATTRRSSSASRAACELFEGGAQGEHKLARGLLPQRTLSAHWLAHPQFARAVEQFLSARRAGSAPTWTSLNEHSPFKASGGPSPA